MSKVCDVWVKLPHGLVLEESFGIAMDAKAPATDHSRVILQHGWNQDVDRARIERWLARNKNLACVKRGDIRVIPDDVMAVDSSKNRK